MSSSADALADLLEEHPQTFAEQAGLTLADTPSPLFRLVVLTSLLSANLDARLGLRTARALTDAGWTTAEHLAGASDEERHEVLVKARYLRKQQTARQLGRLAEEVLDRHHGDLRRLRDDADGEPAAVAEALQGLTGIGQVGASIFLREVQAVWPSVRPYADQRVLDLARDRRLPHTPRGLAQAAGTDDLSRVGAALVQADMADRAADREG